MRYRPSPAMIVAVISLVVATTGGAVARALITGASIKDGSISGLDIKNGSIKGIDVKNGSLGTADLNPAAVKSLKGQPGPAGPAGPSAAFHFDSGDGALSWDNLSHVVAELPLPAGNYVIFGKVLAANDAALTEATITCFMSLGGTLIDSAPGRPLAGGDQEYIPLSGRGSLTAAGSATITCTSGPLGRFLDRHIEGIQVGSLS